LVSNKRTESKFKPLEQVTLEVTNVEDATMFHSRVIGKESAHIDRAMDNFDGAGAAELEKPVLKGTICAARFSTDKKWYRCRVLGAAGKGELSIQFIDFGNYEVVKSEGKDIKKLPQTLLQFEPQAFASSLAYVRAPRKDKTLGKEARSYLRKHALNKVHDAVVAEEVAGGHLKLVLMEEGETDWSTSVNAYMVNEGLAAMQKNLDDSTPEDAMAWFDFEEDARTNSSGLWKFGDFFDGDEEDY
jgi:staphylococcal nuclease domain-containing protein 1